MIAGSALYGRLGRFAIVGAIATLSYTVMAWIFTVAMGISGMLASFIAYGLASVLSYCGQRWITFRSDRPHGDALPRFGSVALVGYTVALALPLCLTDWLGANPAIAIIATALIVPVINYVGLDRLVFPPTGNVDRSTPSTGQDHEGGLMRAPLRRVDP